MNGEEKAEYNISRRRAFQFLGHLDAIHLLL